MLQSFNLAGPVDENKEDTQCGLCREASDPWDVNLQR